MNKTKIVLSASRRTDIPAFYMPWFMAQIRKGFFEVVNPFNQHVSTVPASPREVHTIVFWSKNFGPFIEGDYGGQLLKLGYYVFFNFTVNSHCTELEPNIPPLNERLDQLEHLCARYGHGAVTWRFDPICFYKIGNGPMCDNLHDFDLIADKASAMGVSRCITSFLDLYPKVQRRLSSRPGFKFVDPPLVDKVNIVLELEKQLAHCNIDLFTCCEQEVLKALPAKSTVEASSCIPSELLMKLYSGRLSLRRDTGQRVKDGCGCKVSADIGSYRLQPCYHNCLFCYANPASASAGKRGRSCFAGDR